MNIAICDDTLEDRQIIEKYLIDYGAKTGIKFEVFSYESGEDLLIAYKKISFKIIFLDIYLLELTGIDTAKEIRRFDKEVQIIFVTTSTDHAVSSYDVRALHYIVKPTSFSKIEKVLNLCKLEEIKANKQIEVLTGKNFSPIKLTEIIYGEMFKKILTIHTTYGNVESRISLENFELLLGGVPFIRCHRSFIINMDFIKDIEVDRFILNNDEKVPISRSAKVLSVKTYNEYIFSGMRKKLC